MSAAAATFYVDDLVLVGIPLPSVTNVAITPSTQLSTVDVRHFGVNTAAWDSLLASSGPLLQEGGFTTLRFPGGSSADDVRITSRSARDSVTDWQLTLTVRLVDRQDFVNWIREPNKLCQLCHHGHVYQRQSLHHRQLRHRHATGFYYC